MVALSVSISRMISPAANESPSFIFQVEMPPSVMVGDMAGNWNLVKARGTGDWWKAAYQEKIRLEGDVSTVMTIGDCRSRLTPLGRGLGDHPLSPGSSTKSEHGASLGTLFY